MDDLAAYLPLDDERFLELATEAEKSLLEKQAKASTPEAFYFDPPLWEQRSSYITSTLKKHNITTVRFLFLPFMMPAD